jgi:hypothetical protein
MTDAQTFGSSHLYVWDKSNLKQQSQKTAHAVPTPVAQSAQAVVMVHAVVSMASAAIQWITVAPGSVILVHAPDPLRALWMVHADPMPMVGRAITPDSDHVAVYTATVVAAPPSAVLETGMFLLL